MAWLFGLHGFEAALLIIYGALPPAVMNFLFSERYKQEPHKVASIVLLGNLIAVVVLPIVLAFALR
jgi:predicted permease